MSGRSNPDQPRYITGHGLQAEGQPFDSAGRPSRDGSGRGKCACGALSEPLSSIGSRKRWHVEHKADVLAGRWGEGEAS